MDLKCAYIPVYLDLTKIPIVKPDWRGDWQWVEGEGAKDLIWSSFYSESLVLKTALF